MNSTKTKSIPYVNKDSYDKDSDSYINKDSDPYIPVNKDTDTWLWKMGGGKGITKAT